MESQSVGEELRGRVQKRALDSSLIEGVGTFMYCVATHRYLFLLRNSSRYAGTWGLAGGKIDSGEQLLESLYRELAEEIGVDFSTARVIPYVKVWSLWKPWLHHYHTAVPIHRIVHLHDNHVHMKMFLQQKVLYEYRQEAELVF